MSWKDILKLIGLNVGIAVVNVILFSRGLIGLTLGTDALLTAIGVTEIVMSIMAFGYGNYRLLFSEPSQPRLYKGEELAEPKSYVEALEERKDKKVFEQDINTAIEQIYRIEDKDRALDSILSQYFSPQEITFTRFQIAINAVQALFFNNVKKMLNRITIFDYKDYTKQMNKLRNSPSVDGVNVASQTLSAQIKIYNEHIGYVRSVVETNENILVKMDSLLLEISKLDDIDEAGLENIAAIQEINDLIKGVYKNAR